MIVLWATSNLSSHLNFFTVPVGCTVDPVNYFGNEHNSSILRPNKRGREAEDLSRQQKLQISLNYNLCHDEVDRSASIPNHNPVSTGLRLSYDDDEPNSSVTSASGSMTATPSILMSLGDNIRSELERQKDEFDQYLKIQVYTINIKLLSSNLAWHFTSCLPDMSLVPFPSLYLHFF